MIHLLGRSILGQGTCAPIIYTCRSVLLTRSRQSHTRLNRLIVDRLPLALPPHAPGPKVYTLGLLHFAQIYFAFESAWAKLIDAIPTETNGQDPRIVSILKHLHLPQLLRTTRLQEDLHNLFQLSRRETSYRVHDTSMKAPKLGNFISYIEHITTFRPHVLIAYAWVMYMALFNGGRWIRAQLLSAKQTSWSAPLVTNNNNIEYGLMFWHFTGSRDGEDIKDDFKTRIAEIEDLLTADERQEIVAEAEEIFTLCALVVEELDSYNTAGTTITRTLNQDIGSWFSLSWKHVLPIGTARFWEPLTGIFTTLVKSILGFRHRRPIRAQEQEGKSKGDQKLEGECGRKGNVDPA